MWAFSCCKRFQSKLCARAQCLFSFGGGRQWENTEKGDNLGRVSLGNWSSVCTLVVGTEPVSLMVLHPDLSLPHHWTKSSVREDLRSQTDYCAGFSTRLHVLLPLSLYPEPRQVAKGTCCPSWPAHGNALSCWWGQLNSWQWALICYNWKADTAPEGWGRSRLSYCCSWLRKASFGGASSVYSWPE